jgi:SAM-dependent methyltransferase
MTDWAQGYVTDTVYTRNTYPEVYPARLAIATLAGGQLPPDIDRPFRYADLGCGLGLTTTMIAATHPWAEVWGFDFNPAHIDAARRLADAAELTNLYFEEISFQDLARRGPADLPMFDFMVSHGVISWIAPEVRAALMAVIGQRLKPGGLAYLGYNTDPGNAALVPMQKLMRLLVNAGKEPSDQAAKTAVAYLNVLKSSGARYFTNNPLAARRLDDMATYDPHYVAHEFANQHWVSLMFHEVAAEMAAAKCRFVGPSSPALAMDFVSVPAEMQTLVSETTDPMLKEVLRDIGSCNTFRHDVFRRGIAPVSANEVARRLEMWEFAWIGSAAPEPLVLKVPVGEVTGLPEIYRPITDLMFRQGSATINGLRQLPDMAGRSYNDLLQAVLLLLSNGNIRPMLPVTIRHRGAEPTLRLNLAIAESDAMGTALGHLACAAMGGDVTIGPFDMLVVREKLAGHSMAMPALAERVLAAVNRAGQTLQKDGQPVLDMNEALDIVTATIPDILRLRFPALVRLGALPP